MLKELANEIIKILNESEAKNIRIAELKETITSLNVQISELQTQVQNLQVQSDLKLEEVKAIVKELKELVANA